MSTFNVFQELNARRARQSGGPKAKAAPNGWQTAGSGRSLGGTEGAPDSTFELSFGGLIFNDLLIGALQRTPSPNFSACSDLHVLGAR